MERKKRCRTRQEDHKFDFPTRPRCRSSGYVFGARLESLAVRWICSAQTHARTAHPFEDCLCIIGITFLGLQIVHDELRSQQPSFIPQALSTPPYSEHPVSPRCQSHMKFSAGRTPRLGIAKSAYVGWFDLDDQHRGFETHSLQCPTEPLSSRWP